MKKLIILLSILICLCSCSSYTVTKVTDENRHELNGLRFFQPAPYLLVAEKDLLVDGVKTVKESSAERTTTTQKMAVARRELQCSVIYLPNPDEEYSISTYSGKIPEAVRIEDGWRLTGINVSETPGLTAGQLWMLTGTKDLTPGMYSIRYKNGSPFLKKVEIIP